MCILHRSPSLSLKSFGLLEKRSLVCKGITDYQWSPTDHFVAYWVPEQGANPAKVALIQLPSREEIRSKNLFQVSEVGVTRPLPEVCQRSVVSSQISDHLYWVPCAGLLCVHAYTCVCACVRVYTYVLFVCASVCTVFVYSATSAGRRAGTTWWCEWTAGLPRARSN